MPDQHPSSDDLIEMDATHNYNRHGEHHHHHHHIPSIKEALNRLHLLRHRHHHHHHDPHHHDNSHKHRVHHHNHIWTPYLFFCNTVIVLGSACMFGYNLSVVNGPYVSMRKWLNESFIDSGEPLTTEGLNTQWSIAVTLYLFGGVIGSTWFPGALRYGLLLSSIFGMVGEILCFISRYTGSFVPFYIGRAIVGFHDGIGLVLGPQLVNEHSPAKLRGFCGTLYSLWIAIGLEIANLLGLNFILGTDALWHYLFLVAAGFYLIHGIGMFFVVESPRWLEDKGKEKEAHSALMKLRHADTVDDVADEFAEIKLDSMHEASSAKVGFRIVVKDRRLWWPMIVAIVLHINNELTGLSAVLIYATLVMTSAGLDANTAAYANFGLTAAMIFGNIICELLCEKLGRRKLILIGTMSLAILNVFLVIVLSFNIFQAAIAGFAAFLLLFTCGPGPVPWFMPSEMFPQAARPLALQVVTFVNWIANIIVSFCFPIMQLHIQYYSFLPFAVISLINFVFFLLFLPETSTHLAHYSNADFEEGKPLLQLGDHTTGRKKRTEK